MDQLLSVIREVKEKRKMEVLGIKQPSKRSLVDCENISNSDVPVADGRTVHPPRKSLHGKKSKNSPQTQKTPNLEAQATLERSEVEKKLRSLCEPIRLFAESKISQVKRLKLAQLSIHEKKTSSKGTGNEFMNIQNEIEQEIENAKASIVSKENKSLGVVAKADLASKKCENFKEPEDFLIHFFNRLLMEWGESLERRPIAEKLSREGKKATAIQKQSCSYLKPFFEQLSERRCNKGITEQMERVASLMQKRQYMQAHNEYLTMSIGNAPWPMGLTMVSIHQRRGREGINSNRIAHIMNDEETRKYIQAVKRLITFCEAEYPAGSS